MEKTYAELEEEFEKKAEPLRRKLSKLESEFENKVAKRKESCTHRTEDGRLDVELEIGPEWQEDYYCARCGANFQDMGKWKEAKTTYEEGIDI